MNRVTFGRHLESQSSKALIQLEILIIYIHCNSATFHSVSFFKENSSHREGNNWNDCRHDYKNLSCPIQQNSLENQRPLCHMCCVNLPKAKTMSDVDNTIQTSMQTGAGCKIIHFLPLVSNTRSNVKGKPLKY